MDDALPPPGLGHNMPPEPTLAERFEAIIGDVDTIAARGTALPPKITEDGDVERYAEVVNATRALMGRIDTTRKAENEPHRKAQTDNNAFFGALADRLDRMKKILEERTTAFITAKAAEERRRRAAEAARLEEEARERARAAAEANAGIESDIARHNAEHAEQQAARAAAEASGSTADMVRTRTAGGTVTARTELTFRVPDYSKLDLRELRESIGVDAIDKAIRAHVKRHKKTRPLTGVEIFETSKASFRG